MLDHYPDGVWLAQLAPLSDPALVPKAIATALGIPEQPGRALTDTIVDYVRPRSPLLVLDNCEHLLEACAQLADALLQACPKLRIVATSREPLGIAGELTYRVPSLSLPDPKRLPPVETLIQYEAVRLFVERATFSKPGFQLTTGNATAVVRVTHRLDGIPLAIELAAARAKALPVDVIAARLDDQFRLLTGGNRAALPRHQTLRATLDWSYDLLSEQERILLRRLSVFVGGFTLEAAEKICVGEGVDEPDILDLTSRLIEKSLVLFDEREKQTRYQLPETVRQYGGDRLQEAGESDEIRRRHLHWYLALVEPAYSELFGAQQVMLFERLETEHDNLRAALDWSKAEKDGAEAELRLVGALHPFWNRRGHLNEGRTRMEEALARSSHAPLSVLEKVLRGAGHFAWKQADYESATTLAERGLTLCRDLGHREGTIPFLRILGLVAVRRGDYERAKVLYDEALELARAGGSKYWIGWALDSLGTLAMRQGHYERAAELFSDSLTLFQETGEIWGNAYALFDLGDVTLRQGDYRRAAALFAKSLILCRQADFQGIRDQCLEGLAEVASAEGDCERAARLLGAANAMRETLGFRYSPAEQVDHDRRVASTRAGLGEVAFDSAWAAGRAMTREQAIEYALAEKTS